jgi:hypothetical protein
MIHHLNQIDRIRQRHERPFREYRKNPRAGGLKPARMIDLGTRILQIPTPFPARARKMHCVSIPKTPVFASFRPVALFYLLRCRSVPYSFGVAGSESEEAIIGPAAKS